MFKKRLAFLHRRDDSKAARRRRRSLTGKVRRGADDDANTASALIQSRENYFTRYQN